jgi:hypothetical protein
LPPANLCAKNAGFPAAAIRRVAENESTTAPMRYSTLGSNTPAATRPEAAESLSWVGTALLEYWQAMRGNRAMPARADIDPADIPKLLANILLVDVSQAPLDFRYRLLGTAIVARSEADYTGVRVADLPHQRPPSIIWSLYEAAVREGKPALRLVPYLHNPHRFAEIQALPLSADGETVDMLVCSIAFDRDRYQPDSMM